MKNTVKKILALVFVVAMVCTLAVPAFAADETIPVKVTVIDIDGKVTNYDVAALKLSDANVKEAIEAATTRVAFKSGKVTTVDGVSALTNPADKTQTNPYETSSWTVAVNGKIVSENLSTAAVAKNDKIVVYWADTTLGTILPQMDTSAIAEGIVSFYYYTAAGEKKVLKDATVVIPGVENKLVSDGKFVTDEKGQIWLAPEYLDEAATFAVESVDIADLKAKDKNETDEQKYFNANLSRNIEDGALEGAKITVKGDLYNTAGATGDMTVVYVLVAAAAIITLGAVVVLKKKSAKAL